MDEQAELREDWRTPLPGRLANTDPHRADVVARHETALQDGLPTYTDPRSGFSVFTAAFLANRRYCCDSGCRHCPYAP